MNKKLFVTYSDVYLQWLLGPGDGSHPTNPVRAKLATELLERDLADQVLVIDPQPANKRASDIELLEKLHDPEYVARTIAGDNTEWYRTAPTVGEAALAMFGGTVRAVELILSGEANVVFNPQGAKHHARFKRGSGFCVFNDMAYAALAFKQAGLKVLYIDWDIHAGDGVYHMLEGSGIPTISIHLGSAYPGDPELQRLDGDRGEKHDPAKHNYNFNVQRGDGDDVFKGFIDEAALIIDQYQPDVILVAAGADGHTGRGNLGELANYTQNGFRYAAEMIAEKANAYSNGRVLIGGAGGYQPLKETPETWALVVETIYNNTKKGA